MPVTSLRSFQRRQEERRQSEMHQRAAEILNDEVEILRQFAVDSRPFAQTVQGWFYHEMGKRPPVDQINAFYLTISSAHEYLGETIINDLCIEYGSDDIRRWVLIEGLTRVGLWVEQFGMIPQLEKPDTLQAYVDAHYTAIRRWLVAKLVWFYSETIPTVNKTRYLTLVDGVQITPVPRYDTN